MFEIFAFVAIVVALMNMFLVGRHTRADEETGRAELIRSARVGRHAPLAAALGLAGLANLAVGGAGVRRGRRAPACRSAARCCSALAVAAVGLTFAALTAVAVQVFENARAVYGAVGARPRRRVRAAGRRRRRQRRAVLGSPRSAGASARSRTSDDRWWPLLLPLARHRAAGRRPRWRCWTAATSAPAWCRPGPGRATASPALGSPFGLAWRLQRGALVGWAVGLSPARRRLRVDRRTASSSTSPDNPEVAEFLPGGAADIVDAYLALTIVHRRP